MLASFDKESIGPEFFDALRGSEIEADATMSHLDADACPSSARLRKELGCKGAFS